MKNKDFWKIVVECVKEVKRVEPINLIGVCAIEIKADRDIFFSRIIARKKNSLSNGFGQE
jgi:hypothetical protein